MAPRQVRTNVSDMSNLLVCRVGRTRGGPRGPRVDDVESARLVTTGRVTIIRHNVEKAAERWIQFTLIKGKRIDVCKVLAN